MAQWILVTQLQYLGMVVAKKLYIKTFGCQMNEYDSDKDGRRAARRAGHGEDRRSGARRRDSVQHLLGARESAGKSLSRSGTRQASEKTNPDLLIGVGGCVASQEGAAIVKRAPYVDLVFGPQTLHRLPELISARARHAAIRRWTSPSPKSKNLTTCRPPEPRA